MTKKQEEGLTKMSEDSERKRLSLGLEDEKSDKLFFLSLSMSKDPFFSYDDPKTPTTPVQSETTPVVATQETVSQGTEIKTEEQVNEKTTEEPKTVATPTVVSKETELEKNETPEKATEKGETQAAQTYAEKTEQSTENRSEEKQTGGEQNKEKKAEQKKTGQLKKKVVKTADKKGMSFKLIMFGCVGFGLIIMIGIAMVLYSMLQNPDQARSIIPRETGQALLITFAAVFFGVFFFVGFGILTVNAYRFFSKKKKKRIGYAFGMILGFVLLALSIGAGIPIVSTLAETNAKVSDNVVDPYVILKDGPTYLYSTPRVLMIAPFNMYYKLNEDAYKTKILPQLGNAQIQNLQLNCGNGQILPYSQNDGGFANCFYATHGSYSVSLTIVYVDRQSGEQRETVVKIADMDTDAGIAIQTSEGDISFNDKQTEMIVGMAPAKVTVNAQGVITNFSMKENTIERDTDEDGEMDIVGNVQRTKNFLRSRLQNISYKVAGISNYVYQFDLRILQPDTPICVVKVTQQSESAYNFNVNFVEGQEPISQYAYQIKDVEGGGTIKEIKYNKNSLTHDIDQQGLFAVKASFITKSGKKGSCESEDFRVGEIPYTANLFVSAKTPANESYERAEELASIEKIDEGYILSELPTYLRLKVEDIRPTNPYLQIQVLYDEKPLLSTKNDEFELTVTSPGEHSLDIRLYDQQTKETTLLKNYKISVNQEQIIGKVVVAPNTVGIDPFTVTFDASVTKVNDPGDEIVSFTWDFGDGDIKQNISQGVVQHTYYFDNEKQAGTYRPKVTMITKKGRTITAIPENPIIVKKAVRQASIAFISHPAQLAKLGDSVTISLTVDGIPSKILREFGDDRLECSGRECMEVNRIFQNDGTHEVSVTVSYDDHPDIKDKSKIRVQ